MDEPCESGDLTRDDLVAARGGDEHAFSRLVEGWTRELHAHCYRMLGSVHDAEDAVQETLLRAWRHLDHLQDRNQVRAWLYRIATNVCLTALTCRAKRLTAASMAPTGTAEDAEAMVSLHLTPYPDRWVAQIALGPRPPEAHYELRESLQLAFLAAVQVLPPRERAALLLHDVVGFRASEVAGVLGGTAAAVHSLLQRARGRLHRRRSEGWLRYERIFPGEDVERQLIRRFIDAWEANDVGRLVALLSEDAILTMPPYPIRFQGRRPISQFFSTVPAGGRLDRIRLLQTRANGEPALAAYSHNAASGSYVAYGIMVITVDRNAIAEITGFADPSLFPYFNLPHEMAG